MNATESTKKAVPPKTTSRLTTSIPATLPAEINIRKVGFRQMLAYLGLENDFFYVADSLEQPMSRSLLRPFKSQGLYVLFVDSGTLTLRHNTATLTLGAGSLLLRTKDAVIQVRHFSADCRVRVFGFTQELISRSSIHKKHLEALSFLSAQAAPVIQLDPSEAGTMQNVLDILQEKSKMPQRSPYYEEAVAHAFALFVFEVAASLGRRSGTDVNPSHRNEHLTYQFLRLVPAHVLRERSVQFYAAQLNVSAKYLSRCVKEVTGNTCSAIIDGMVIQEAKALLDDPDLSIKQVANGLGFNNPFHFSKFFKEQTGIAPTGYRESN
ncbi:AraC family transcriptional regulator [Flaviaesturariibacter flavus]|uniref:AraC family transcriptional regulator n=1 Tax=Flaviaesturariibacter flavus TaxID=2502780 RepID=A0A4R1B802_9BACT|nr:helix-turn-helix domain-containing protein [Flaviaesturariibacter flavus]TCJ12093.1 AraC family transcriptional regulator [Flaviaesturariibacter flavus]